MVGKGGSQPPVINLSVSSTEGVIVVRPTESFRSRGFITSVGAASASTFCALIPVFEQASTPIEILAPFVRNREVLVHERHDDLNEIAKRLDNEARLVVVVWLSAWKFVHAANAQCFQEEHHGCSICGTEADCKAEAVLRSPKVSFGSGESSEEGGDITSPLHGSSVTGISRGLARACRILRSNTVSVRRRRESRCDRCM